MLFVDTRYNLWAVQIRCPPLQAFHLVVAFRPYHSLRAEHHAVMGIVLILHIKCKDWALNVLVLIFHVSYIGYLLLLVYP